MRFLLLPAFLLNALLLSACDDGGSNGASVSEQQLRTDDPLEYASLYVQTVQGDADQGTYGRFLNPGIRAHLDEGSEMELRNYRNALRQNAHLASTQALVDATVSVEHIAGHGEMATIRFDLPEPLAHDIIYPDSPMAGEGWVIQSGHMMLQRVDGRWTLNGHSFDGVKP